MRHLAFYFFMLGFAAVGDNPAKLSLLTQYSSTLNSSGSSLSGAVTRLDSSLGLGMATFTSVSSNYAWQAGFHHSSVMSSNSRDSDGDGLVDWLEFAGLSFDPTTPSSAVLADSDGDGASDLEEVKSGTNPMNASSLFSVTSIRVDGGHFEVTWLARGGKTYRFYSLPDLNLMKYANYFWAGSVAVEGGAGPWLETYATYRIARRNNHEFIHIELGE